MIIGLSGYARSGKDSVADVLATEFGFQKIAFADKLRECLYELNPVILWDQNETKVYEAILDYMPLKWIIDTYGWDGYKDTGWNKHIRIMLQRMGTDVGRNILGGDIWRDATLRVMDLTKDYVVTDCRFQNEAYMVAREGGKVWRVNRPGVGPANDHISEVGLDDYPFDTIIPNDGDLTYLAKTVRLALVNQ